VTVFACLVHLEVFLECSFFVLGRSSKTLSGLRSKSVCSFNMPCSLVPWTGAGSCLPFAHSEETHELASTWHAVKCLARDKKLRLRQNSTRLVGRYGVLVYIQLRLDASC
jgi:hypothetical protein